MSQNPKWKNNYNQKKKKNKVLSDLTYPFNNHLSQISQIIIMLLL